MNSFLFYITQLIIFICFFCSSSYGQTEENLPQWSEGYLDIHHINTGKGDATFFIFPDRTTSLLDAGAVVRERPPYYDSPQRPNASYRPGEWVARYIKTFHPEGENGALDYAAITHFHGDHMGTVTDDSPIAESDAYQLTGITDVGEKIPVRTMIDRGWPDYDYPSPLQGEMMDNYRAFLQWHIEHNGMDVQQFAAGRNDQIKLIHAPEKYPNFELRNIAVNGKVWTGSSTEVRNRFPTDNPPSENNCSLAFRITYGDFVYFSGGDIAGTISSEAPAWHDMESALAWIVGPVDVHALNHHGFRDSANAFFLSVLQPRVHILSVYAASHPGPDVMKRVLSERIYAGFRDIFLTNGLWKGRRSNMADLFGDDKTAWLEARIEEATGSQGHVVVRIEPGGQNYRVFVLDDTKEDFQIVSTHGKYEAQGGNRK